MCKQTIDQEEMTHYFRHNKERFSGAWLFKWTGILYKGTLYPKALQGGTGPQPADYFALCLLAYLHLPSSLSSLCTEFLLWTKHCAEQAKMKSSKHRSCLQGDQIKSPEEPRRSAFPAGPLSPSHSRTESCKDMGPGLARGGGAWDAVLQRVLELSFRGEIHLYIQLTNIY